MKKKIYILKTIGLSHCNYNFTDNKDCFFLWAYCFAVSCVHSFRSGVGRFLADRHWLKIELDSKAALSSGLTTAEATTSLHYKVQVPTPIFSTVEHTVPSKGVSNPKSSSVVLKTRPKQVLVQEPPELTSVEVGDSRYNLSNMRMSIDCQFSNRFCALCLLP